MGIFSSLVKTAVETACIPFDVGKDAISLGNAMGDESHTVRRMKRIKQAASDREDDEMDPVQGLFDD